MRLMRIGAGILWTAAAGAAGYVLLMGGAAPHLLASAVLVVMPASAGAIFLVTPRIDDEQLCLLVEMLAEQRRRAAPTPKKEATRTAPVKRAKKALPAASAPALDRSLADLVEEVLAELPKDWLLIEKQIRAAVNERAGRLGLAPITRPKLTAILRNDIKLRLQKKQSGTQYFNKLGRSGVKLVAA